MLSTRAKGGSFDNRKGQDWSEARNQSEPVTSSCTRDKKGMEKHSVQRDTDSDPDTVRATSKSRASRDEVGLFQRQPRAVCLPWRMRYFFCTQCTFRVGGGSPGLSLPFGRHHTVVLCRPEALRCAHTLQSFIEASYVGLGETNWPGVLLHRTV